MPKFHCFGFSSQDSSDNPNTSSNFNTKRRRFSLTRSLSFSDTFPTKNMGSVSSFFKTIRKNGSKKSSTTGSSPSHNTEEDYGSSWTYYPVGQIVRVNGVDFEIVSPPCVHTPTASGSGPHQPSSQPFENVASTSSEPSESGGSGSGLIEAPETPELRRQASLDSHLRYFETAWRASDEVGTYYRPGSIYGQMMGIDTAIDALMKQEIYSLSPGHQLLVHGDVTSPLPTGAVESAIGNDSENLDPNPKPKHRIRRKPAPAF